MMPPIFRTIVNFGEPSGASAIYDTVLVQGKAWIVTTWVDTPAYKGTRPARVIELDRQLLLAHEGQPPADFVLAKPIARDVLIGDAEPISGPFWLVKNNPPW